MKLHQFTQKVNDLFKKECDNINKNKENLFRAVHNDLPESMLKWYFEEGYTPRATLIEINENAGI